MTTSRSVTLVCGPPCSGKSQLVAGMASTGDVIVCHDELAQQAGSRRSHDHGPVHRDAARGAWEALVDEVAAADVIRAWVIRTAPGAGERAALAERLRATRVIVLCPPVHVLRRRAAQDGRSRRTYGLIERWWSRYTPAAGDEVWW